MLRQLSQGLCFRPCVCHGRDGSVLQSMARDHLLEKRSAKENKP